MAIKNFSEYFARAREINKNGDVDYPENARSNMVELYEEILTDMGWESLVKEFHKYDSWGS